MKYVIFWIEMLKQASELVGLNLHPCDSDDVQLECRKSLLSFCEYRLKRAIRKMYDKFSTENERMAELLINFTELHERYLPSMIKEAEAFLEDRKAQK